MPELKNYKVIFITILVASAILFLGKEPVIVVGDSNSSTTWVYLHGLTSNLYTGMEKHHRQLLDAIGKSNRIKIMVLKSPFTCAQYDNQLCWPHETPEAVLETYCYIQSKIKHQNIAGFIGFSNGGFFLNRLIQRLPIDKHIITIGASGMLLTANVAAKSIIIIIGKQDCYHYAGALNFADQLKGAHKPVIVIEHPGGHMIPQEILREAIAQISS